MTMVRMKLVNVEIRLLLLPASQKPWSALQTSRVVAFKFGLGPRILRIHSHTWLCK